MRSSKSCKHVHQSSSNYQLYQTELHLENNFSLLFILFHTNSSLSEVHLFLIDRKFDRNVNDETVSSDCHLRSLIYLKNKSQTTRKLETD